VSPVALTSVVMRRRFRIVSALLVAVVMISTAWSISTGYARRSAASYDASSHHYTPSPPPTQAQQSATLVATQAYRREVVRSTQAFAIATTNLVLDIQRGDVTAAREAEQSAQAAYDVFRVDGASSVATMAPLDTLVANQNPALPATGLHAVERDLWSGQPSLAMTAATNLADVSSQLQFGLLRTIITPTQICARLDEEVGWTVENVIGTSQERYSHDDMLDVHAVINNLDATLPSVEQLGRLVNPSATVRVERAMLLVNDLAQQSTSATSNSHVSVQQWRDYARTLDSLEYALGAMSGVLADFGTGRNYA